jgi:hypothetical protein
MEEQFMENDLNRKKQFIFFISEVFLLIFFGICLIICVYNSIKASQNINVSEEAVHSNGISVECPYCGKRAKLVLEIDEK